MADEEKIVVSAPAKPEHGAQVHLTGEARAAARGALAGNMVDNLTAKRALEADGTVADGFSADGTSVTGERQADDLQAEEQDTPTGKPAEASRVEVDNPEAAEAAQAADGIGGTSFTPDPEPEPAKKSAHKPKKG